MPLHHYPFRSVGGDSARFYTFIPFTQPVVLAQHVSPLPAVRLYLLGTLFRLPNSNLLDSDSRG